MSTESAENDSDDSQNQSEHITTVEVEDADPAERRCGISLGENAED